MATKQRSRSRNRGSNSFGDRGPRYVAPVLDPAWQNPYAPTTGERHENQRAVRSFALRRNVPLTIAVTVLVVALIVGVVVLAWLPAVGLVVALGFAWDLRRSLVRFERSGESLGAAMLAQFQTSGTAKDRQRLVTVLDRLAATFGVDAVNASIVSDPGYNAALVPDGAGLSLFVTDSLMRDFELIELEGVVAHCLARHRLGLLAREGVACVGVAERCGRGAASRDRRAPIAPTRSPPRRSVTRWASRGHCESAQHQLLPSTSFFTSPTFATVALDLVRHLERPARDRPERPRRRGVAGSGPRRVVGAAPVRLEA